MRFVLLTYLCFILVLQAAMGEQSGDWVYSVSNNKAIITGYTGAGGAVAIPSSVNCFPVGQVGSELLAPVFGFPNRTLTSLTIPNSVTSIGGQAFFGCKSLGLVNIPNSVTAIGSGAFSQCSSLVSISIPNSVTSIGGSAFSQCTSLTEVVLPSQLTAIEGQSFYRCTALTKINIPNYITRIGYSAFQDCWSLTKITLPSALRTLEAGVFYGCVSLIRVEFLGDVPTSTGVEIFVSAPATIYYLANRTGWGSSFAYRDTALIGTYRIIVSYETSRGGVTINPLKSFYTSGENVSLVASPYTGYLFAQWSGASTATASTLAITMDSDKVLTSSFVEDIGDADGDGLNNFQESVVYGSNPNQRDTSSDGIEDGQAVTLGYSPNLSFSALIAHLQSNPPAGLYTASQMQTMAFGDLVLSKNANGSFTLNYDIEQSTDLQNWSTYAPLSMPLTGLPEDKAFVRIKAKQ